MGGLERQSKTGKNSTFQAQCDHSHICCLLGQYTGYYRCSKFLTLLLKFIAFLGFSVSWAKMGLKNAQGISHAMKGLRGSIIVAESAKHMLPCVGERIW